LHKKSQKFENGKNRSQKEHSEEKSSQGGQKGQNKTSIKVIFSINNLIIVRFTVRNRFFY